jgi:hypothetical protein
LKVRREDWADEIEGRNPEDYTPDMPPLVGMEHLLHALFEIGPVTSGAAGPIGQADIGWYQWNTGVRFTAWECRTLRNLSAMYLDQSNKATQRDCKPPWITPYVKPEKTALQLSIRNFDNSSNDEPPAASAAGS